MPTAFLLPQRKHLHLYFPRSLTENSTQIPKFQKKQNTHYTKRGGFKVKPPFPFRLQHTQINLWSQQLPGAMHKPQGQKWSLDPKKNRHRFLDHVDLPPIIAHSFCERWAVLIHHLKIRIVHSQSPKESCIIICQVYLVPLPKEANLDHTIKNISEILEL